MAFEVPPGRIRIWRAAAESRTRDPWRVYCFLGKTRPKPIRGYGGWGSHAREGRSAVATFGGVETPAYAIELRIARGRPWRGKSVEEQMRNLERLAGWDRYDDEPPPSLNFAANVAHDQDDAPQNEWLCESLEWGDSNADDAGVLLWQDATIVLGLDVTTDVPGLGRMRAFPRKRLRVGWDLRDFARRHLGDPKRWKDVAALNRDNPRCPQSPHFKPSKPLMLLVPPRESKSRKDKRRDRRR